MIGRCALCGAEFMQRVAVFVVGFNKWAELTLPLLQSIERCEPGLEVVLVDNGSDPAYPGYANCRVVRSDNYSLARAYNVGMRACGAAEWYLFLTNDLICEGPFVHLIGIQAEDTIYGPRVVHHDDERVDYVDSGWMLLSRRVWEAVGEMDEEYRVYTYEDIDYCKRAQEVGFRMEQMGLPFHHKGQESRVFHPDYDEIRERNRGRFWEKFGL